MPTLLLPSPSLQSIVHPYHIPCRPRHKDRRPFAPHGIAGGVRLCMPTMVSYLRSNAFRPTDVGQPGEGEVFNLNTEEWEEFDVLEEEMAMEKRVCIPSRH